MTVQQPKHEWDYDVAVIGGGPAGIAAALAAANSGARVLLVEGDRRLGGNVAEALVHTICGLYLPSAHNVPVHAHEGIPRAFAAALTERGEAGKVEWAGTAGFLPIDPDAFSALAESFCDRLPLLERAMGTRLTRLELPLGNHAPFALEFESVRARHEPVTAWTVIDTTGDANAAALLGVPTDIAAPEDLQHASYIFRIDGVETVVLDAMERARTTTVVAREARRGELGETCSSIVLHPSVRPHSVFVTMNLPKPDPARFDPFDAEAFEELRERAAMHSEDLLRFLVRERPAFRHAHEGARPARVGVRETRRIQGLERLDVDAVLEGRRRDDEACLTTWPIELWSSHERMVFRHTAGPASIPLGCLIADHPSARFAMAGRCASASHEALGAIRVIGTSMAMGEAAGVACALAARPALTLTTIDPARVRHAVHSKKTTAGL